MLNRLLLENTIKQFGLSLDDEAFSRLDSYAEMLIETNKSFNLTAITELDEVTVKHFADCLSIFGYINIPEGAKIIDVGTGAGFPGLVMQLYRPDLKVSFLDSTLKRLNFISEVLDEAGIEAEIIHSRAEDAGKDVKFRENFDFATARAVANLSVLSEYCLPFVKTGGSFIAMKSFDSEDEILQAQTATELLGGKIENNFVFDLVENTPRRIIEIKKISQTPTGYPRNAKKIANSPIK